MDLEKAYNKIDNFCCSNHNALQGNKVRYLNGREETIDMFSDYKENKDDDFCKDAYEMVDALETIKEVVDLQKEKGCLSDVLLRAVRDGIYYEYSKWAFGRVKFQKLQVCLVYDYGEYRLQPTHKADFSIDINEYKKTFWLKEDKSE